MGHDERLMTLAQGAAEIGLKVSSLRTEIRRGRLTPIEIAGKFYVTKKLLGDMVQACRAKPRGHDSSSSDTATGTDGGSSSTGDPNVALAAANMSLQALKGLSRRTSPRSINRREKQPA